MKQTPRKNPTKPYTTGEGHWAVVDGLNAYNNWPFLPLFTSFSEAYAYAKEKNKSIFPDDVRYHVARLLPPSD